MSEEEFRRRLRAFISNRVDVPIENAITWWRDAGFWSDADVAALRGLVEERTPPPGLGLYVRGGMSEEEYEWLTRDRIESAYALVPRDQTDGLDDDTRFSNEAMTEWLLGRPGLASYVAFTGERGTRQRKSGLRKEVNLLVAAPGYIEVVRADQTERIDTYAAKNTTGRNSASPELEFCPECFLALATGSSTCDSCGWEA